MIAAALLLSASASRAEDFLVTQSNKTFTPETLTIKRGDRVVFVNNDTVTHNMYSDTEGSEFNLGAQKPGEKTGIRLTVPGTVEVQCEIHPQMHLEIEVK